MNSEQIKQKKEELMKPDWTENLHLTLEGFDDKDSKKIVELMSKKEINDKVNNRRFQEDYIADYLMYLWKISKVAYWKHIKETFDKNEGLLWGADMKHYGILCNNELEDDLFERILQFTFTNDKLIEQDEEGVFCIINAQINKFNRYDFVKDYIQNLDNKFKPTARMTLEKWIGKDCNYYFG